MNVGVYHAYEHLHEALGTVLSWQLSQQTCGEWLWTLDDHMQSLAIVS